MRPWLGERDGFYIHLVGFIAGLLVYSMFCAWLFGDHNLNATYLFLSYLALHSFGYGLFTDGPLPFDGPRQHEYRA
jgi:hypothetical protein